MYEGITQQNQNLEQAVPPAQAFIFPTGKLSGAWSFIFLSVVKSYYRDVKNKKKNQEKRQQQQKQANKQKTTHKKPHTKQKNPNSFISFLADLFVNIFSTFVSGCRLYETSM